MARNGGSGGARPGWVEALRRCKPEAIRVLDPNGKATMIALRTGATRWQHAARTAEKQIEEGEGGRVELLDAAGNVLDVLTIDDEDERDANVPDEDDEDVSVALTGSDARLLGLLISAQRMVLREQREMLAPVLDAYVMNARAWADFAAQMMEVARARGSFGGGEEERLDPKTQAMGDKLADALLARFTGGTNVTEKQA